MEFGRGVEEARELHGGTAVTTCVCRDLNFQVVSLPGPAAVSPKSGRPAMPATYRPSTGQKAVNGLGSNIGHASKLHPDRQTSFLEISIEAGILRSEKGAIQASAGLGAVAVLRT